MIIGIAGPTASGKTTVATMLETRLPAKRLRYSGILAEIARERGLDSTDKATLQGIFLTERETKGEDFVAREMEERALTEEETHLVIEGNRRLVDIDMLKRIAKKRNDTLSLIFIDASRETRYERYNRRLTGQGDTPITFEAFIALESNDAEDEVDDIRTIFKREGIYINTDDASIEATNQNVIDALKLI